MLSIPWRFFRLVLSAECGYQATCKAIGNGGSVVVIHALAVGTMTKDMLIPACALERSKAGVVRSIGEFHTIETPQRMDYNLAGL
jgi:hypothetical protein